MNFSQTIIRWYNKNKRDLPWRHTNDPYKIWLSEIILQQTRVQQGLPYYETFVKKFPTVHHLAKAKEDVVMKTWQGLGYYSRARNLHHSAKFISKELKGIFPKEFDEIKKLKGIGEYTAGAIASFAFNKPHPVVDGNVFRVIARYFAITTQIDSTEGKKEFTRKAELLLDKKIPGIFNQAIMEFGAMQCVPQNPDCEKCPLKKSCKALAKSMVSSLPIKSKKNKIQTRYFNYFVIRRNGKILIKKRIENDIWKNLYDFPMIETKKEILPPLSRLLSEPLHRMELVGSDASLIERLGGVSIISVSKSFKHILSHQVIFARFWEVAESEHKKFIVNGTEINDGVYISESQLNKFPFPRLIEKYFDAKASKN
ncbi:MAG: A/G-specific adenine glycosylase [Bacteroidetes bacterium]|nr:A/G-specific adenine glycosylase [Bacteroidota bacterium]